MSFSSLGRLIASFFTTQELILDSCFDQIGYRHARSSQSTKRPTFFNPSVNCFPDSLSRLFALIVLSMANAWQATADQAADDRPSSASSGPVLTPSAEEQETTADEPTAGVSAEEDLEVEVGDVPEGAPEKQGLSWRYGVRYETKSGLLRLRLGGLFQYDWASFNEGGDLPSADDGTEFRRARLVVEGAFRKRAEFRIQYDSANKEGSESIRDLWISAKILPRLGSVKLGHFKEPFGLENLTSSRDITFMARALPNTFVPGRNLGITISNTVFDDRATWAFGFSRDTSNELDADSNSLGLTGRVTGMPWYQEDGRKLLHLGAGFSYRDVDQVDFSYGRRPEAHLAPRYLDTGALPADDLYVVNGELALVYGSFSIQSEYFHSNVKLMSGEDVEFDGIYAQASYFLTGEHRPYKTSTGVFYKVVPNRNFFIRGVHGPGAWEVAVRYSHIDLNDGDILGGKEHNITAAVNWYMNSNARILFNYVYGDIDSSSGEGAFHAFQGRLQIAF